MPSDNPISDISEGVTKALIELSLDNIKGYIYKLKNKDLAFIEELETIEVVKEQYNSGEAKFYKKYIRDKRSLFLVRIGLTLRKIENNLERRNNLRSKIKDKYGIDGLHVAEFVQNGVLNRYVGSILLEQLVSIEKLENDLDYLLKNIEKHTIFVLGTSNKAEIIKKADIMINATSPNIFIISGFKSAATIVQESIENLKIIMKDYELERTSTGEKEILFFKRKLTA